MPKTKTLARYGLYTPLGVRVLTIDRLSPARIRKFVTELVNLRRDKAAALRVIRQFSDFRFFNQRFLRALTGSEYELTGPKPEFLVGLSDLDVGGTHFDYIIDVGDVRSEKVEADQLIGVVEELVRGYLYEMFRAVWIEPDGSVRAWGWAILRTNLAGFWHPTRRGESWNDAAYLNLQGEVDRGSLTSRLPAPPEPLPVEQAFEYLIAHHAWTRHCNNPDCPAPLFFARRHTQRYCSEKCAQAGEKESKRKWWAAHGDDWRNNRMQRAAMGNQKSSKRDKPSRKGK